MKKHRRTLTKAERALIGKALQIASDNFRAAGNVAPTGSLTADYYRQSIEAERLAAILAEADSIVLETTK